MIKIWKLIGKIVATIFLISITTIIVIKLPSEKTIIITDTYKINDNIERSITKETKRPYSHQFFEWLALGSFIASIWLWHKELGIKGFLGVESDMPEISQQEPDKTLIPEKQQKINKDKSPAKEEIYNRSKEKKLEEFLFNYKKYGFFRVLNFSEYSSISQKEAEELLYKQVQEGVLRVDFNPLPIFSLAKSYENQIIDSVSVYILKTSQITREIRFGTVNNTRFDALYETENSIFLVEVKINSVCINNNRYMQTFSEFSRALDKFHKENKFIVLGIGYTNNEDSEKIINFSKSYSYNDKNTRLVILPVMLKE